MYRKPKAMKLAMEKSWKDYLADGSFGNSTFMQALLNDVNGFHKDEERRIIPLRSIMHGFKERQDYKAKLIQKYKESHFKKEELMETLSAD